MTIADELKALETSLLDHSVRKDPAQVASLLSDQFREFGSSGRVYSKAEIVAALQSEPEGTITLSYFAVVELAEGTMLVTYRSRREGSEALRSSVWRMEAGQWRIIFHQGTPTTINGAR